jgi:ATP-dependent RNA helicase DDX54/DBP10
MGKKRGAKRMSDDDDDEDMDEEKVKLTTTTKGKTNRRDDDDDDDVGGGSADDGEDDEEDDERVDSSDKAVGGGAKKKKSKGGFHALKLNDATMLGVRALGFKQPTPIQRKAIPPALLGRNVVAMARTGSGKTAAFLIPVIERLKEHKPESRCVVLSPTRELAQQSYKIAKTLGKRTDLRFCLIQGGDSMEAQFDALAAHPDVVVATPGRLAHLLVETKDDFSLGKVEMFVIDEADRVFEMGFAAQLHEIISRTPDSKQTLLFSATMPKQLADFARAKMTDPELIRLDTETRVSDSLKLAFFKLRSPERLAGLMYLMREHIDCIKESTIVFCGTKHEVEFVGSLLRKAAVSKSGPSQGKRGGQMRRRPKFHKRGKPSGEEDDYDDDDDDDGVDDMGVAMAHGSMDHVARMRSLEKFRSGQAKIFVVTDLAARGLDIPHVNNVVNYDFPDKPKLFVHRVGRAARQGRTGTAYSFATPDELGHLVDVMLFLGRPLLGPNSDIGSFPQHVLDEGVEWITSTIESDPVLEQLYKSAVNAHKMYVKTRIDPSRRSIKRVKEELDGARLPVHAILTNLQGGQVIDETASNDNDAVVTFADLAAFRPKKTTFEIEQSKKGSTTGQPSKNDKKSNAVAAVVEFARLRKRREMLAGKKAVTESTNVDQHDAGGDDEGLDPQELERVRRKRLKSSAQADESSANDDQSTHSRPRLSAAEKRKAKKLGMDPASAAASRGPLNPSSSNAQEATPTAPAPGLPTGAFRDPKFYISHEGSSREHDAGDDYESHLRVDRLEDAVLDLVADDTEGLATKARSFQWDKRKKKYIQSTLKDHIQAKRVKTTSDVPMDVKAEGEAYNQWAKRTRRRIGHVADDDDDATTDVRALARKRREARSANSSYSPGGRRIKDELKNEDQFVKGRKEKRKLAERARGERRKERVQPGADARRNRIGKQKTQPKQWSRSRVGGGGGGGRGGEGKGGGGKRR